MQFISKIEPSWSLPSFSDTSTCHSKHHTSCFFTVSSRLLLIDITLFFPSNNWRARDFYFLWPHLSINTHYPNNLLWALVCKQHLCPQKYMIHPLLESFSNMNRLTPRTPKSSTLRFRWSLAHFVCSKSQVLLWSYKTVSWNAPGLTSILGLLTWTAAATLFAQSLLLPENVKWSENQLDRE